MNKVDVLTSKDVTFKKYRWWSDWVDIAVLNHSYTGYLLQMKVSRTNAKKFNAIPMEGYVAYANISQAGDLVQMENHNG